MEKEKKKETECQCHKDNKKEEHECCSKCKPNNCCCNENKTE